MEGLIVPYEVTFATLRFCSFPLISPLLRATLSLRSLAQNINFYRSTMLWLLYCTFRSRTLKGAPTLVKQKLALSIFQTSPSTVAFVRKYPEQQI